MVDLGGYIIILMNDNGKIKLYGSSADNADNPEVGDEILEVNGRTLENATDAEVSQYIHQCIKSGTISLQVTRRTGNKMKELDGPNADRIRDAWVIALERGARERLQRLPALRKIQPRDIQAILHQQITEGSASTSTGETPKKDVTNSHITVTLADREAANRNVQAKLSNGTVPKGVTKEEDELKDSKDVLQKQRSCPEEANLLQPVPGGRTGERRASSPFQNGRTEVLIGETEGGPRSPRGSTSSAANDANFLIPPGDPDYPESIYKSRRRSGSGVADIHLQPSQLQENNNGGSRDIVKGGESRESRVEVLGGPDEMWAPGSSPGHHRELPVDVPDTLLQQAYANKQVMSMMMHHSETTTTTSSSTSSSSYHLRSSDLNDETNFGTRRSSHSPSDHEKTDNHHHHHQNHHHHHHHHHHNHNHIMPLNVKTNNVTSGGENNLGFVDSVSERIDSPIQVPRVEDVHVKSTIVSKKNDNENQDEENNTLARIIEINVRNESEERELSSPLPIKVDDDIINNEEDRKIVDRMNIGKIQPFDVTDDEEEVDRVSADSPQLVIRSDATSPSVALLQKESSVDADEDYPFAKEDYPTMLKTCSDDSASPRSSSGRSDSTAPLDSSLILAGKESPLYDARRIDLGSPCRPLVPEIKIAPLFSRGRETTSFDNPAYGLAADLHDLHQGLLMRSDEVTDLTRLIDEQQNLVAGRKPRTGVKNPTSPLWTSKDHLIHQHLQIRNAVTPSEVTRSKKKASSKRLSEVERLKSRSNRDSDMEIDSEGLIGAGSTDDLLSAELSNLSMTRLRSNKKKKQQQQSSSGYSTLRSDASIGEFSDQQADRSFLVVGNRSYREVAVDCPPDFIPVTKRHPVYPPPNKTDNTIDRNSMLKNLQTDNHREKFFKDTSNRLSTLVHDECRIDSRSAVVAFNGQCKDSNKCSVDKSNSKLENDDHDNDNKNDNDEDNDQVDHFRLVSLQQHVKLEDVRNDVVSALGRNIECRQEKVRTGVKSRLLRYKARLHSFGQSPSKTLLHAYISTDVNSARIPAKHRFTAYSNSSLIPAYTTSSSSPNTFLKASLKSSENLPQLQSPPPSSLIDRKVFVSRNEKYINLSKNAFTIRKLPDDFHYAYVDDKIPKSRSTLNLVQRETNENSRNSLRELVNRRDSTPVIVYYSSKDENTWFFEDQRCLSQVRGDNINEEDEEESIGKKSNANIKNLDYLNDIAHLQNAKNSMLSLEYRLIENAERDDGICKKLFDSPSKSEKRKKFSKVFQSHMDIYENLKNEKVGLPSRSWFSEPCLVSAVSKLDQDQFSSIPSFRETFANQRIHEESIGTKVARPEIIEDDSVIVEDPEDLKCQRENLEQPGLNGVKPAIPPRDQKRAPARPPKDNVRLSTRNNNIEQTDNANTPEPTQQQLNSIRKYQEQLRKRKDEEERQEYLNRSLRGSRKLQALESHATSLSGQENPAYAQDEVTSAIRSIHGIPEQTAPREVEEPPKVLTYGEVVATLERLQLQLRNLSGALGISGPGVEAELEAVRTLLVQRRFATALATHQVLKTRLRTGKVLKHHDDDASNLARDCVEVLEEWQSTSVGAGETRAMVEELTGLLTSYEMEGLLLAHDSIISYVDGIPRKQSPSSSSPSRSPSPSSSLRGSRNTDNIRIIRIEKTNEPLGATVRNEGDAVIIGRVVRGGAADKSGLFHEGDEVLEVNGVEMRGKGVNEVCDILAGMQGGLTFLVLPASSNLRNNVTNTRREDSTQIQHVRAHFDYDPEEDPYIPCRELGVSFQKGDVLHVISQEDSNWWQAYREGEEDHTLAGLIPSRAFQHQRESIKQTIAGGKSTLRGSKKSSTLLCTRKNPKKKKKRSKFGPNFNDEGYPLYATTTIDDYDSEEVLTYEEVALYYPRANHKRPIVLIGPPNIGRHELRQRLMQDSERFAAAIPHTSRTRKGSEVDGQDYHFISRSQFESDILCRKFVEHGEYEKAYYGTSVEAIRSVVNSGKICVLNLHPQSLKILRSSDLKPYVVFVAPPSLEKLRQKRIKNNESFKEEELKDIIEKAREMEDKYGHLFDMIILNNDTDRAYNQLLTEINSLEREPQWVPASWVQ